MNSIQRFAWSGILVAIACGSPTLLLSRGCAAETQTQLLFTSQGKTARINIDGSGLQCFNFPIPNQASSGT